MYRRMTQLDWRVWIRKFFANGWISPVPIGLHLFRPGTSHIAAVDHTGLAISEITTINLLFGSRIMVPETGIIMNNEMDGKARERPRSNAKLTVCHLYQTFPQLDHQTHSDISPRRRIIFDLESVPCRP